MKYEWRRQEKQLYGAKTTPVLVTVPTQSCIMINGEGNPNDTDFSNRVSALYSVAYAVKMAYKKTAKGEYDGRPPGNLPEQCHPHRKKQAQNHFAL